MSINSQLFEAEQLLCKLTAKRKRFVEEYLKDCNSTQAYTRAGFKASTDRVAQVEGNKLLHNPEVSACIEAFQQARSMRTQITADRVLEELARIAFSDIGQVIGEGGTIHDLASLSEDARRAIASLKVKSDKEGNIYVSEIRLWDKMDALTKLCDHLGLTKPREESGNSQLADFLAKQIAMINEESRGLHAGSNRPTQDLGETQPPQGGSGAVA